MEKGDAKHLVLCVGPPFCAPRAVAPIDDAAPGAASVRGFKEFPGRIANDTWNIACGLVEIVFFHTIYDYNLQW